MKASYHVILSGCVALGYHTQVQSWPATAACFLSGVLIDLDHYLEYYIIKKKFPFRYADLWNFCLYNKHPKIFLWFHGYEFLLILWLMMGLFSFNPVYMGIVLGLTMHLVFDQFTNPIKPLFYFIMFRIYHRFEKTAMMAPEYFRINQMRDE